MVQGPADQQAFAGNQGRPPPPTAARSQQPTDLVRSARLYFKCVRQNHRDRSLKLRGAAPQARLLN